MTGGRATKTISVEKLALPRALPGSLVRHALVARAGLGDPLELLLLGGFCAPDPRIGRDREARRGDLPFGGGREVTRQERAWVGPPELPGSFADWARAQSMHSEPGAREGRLEQAPVYGADSPCTEGISRTFGSGCLLARILSLRLGCKGASKTMSACCLKQTCSTVEENCRRLPLGTTFYDSSIQTPPPGPRTHGHLPMLADDPLRARHQGSRIRRSGPQQVLAAVGWHSPDGRGFPASSHSGLHSTHVPCRFRLPH